MGGVFQGLWEDAFSSGFLQAGSFHSLVFFRELLWGFVAEGAVRPAFIVSAAMLLDQVRASSSEVKISRTSISEATPYLLHTSVRRAITEILMSLMAS